MNSDFSRAGLVTALRAYLDAAASLDDLRAYLEACDAALQAGAADPALSGPVGAALLTMMEQDEGVRPPADVRSTLEAALRGLTDDAPSTHRRPERRGLIPRVGYKRKRRR